MSNIDIVTVVDASTLISLVNDGTLQPGTLEAPTNLGSYAGSDRFIFMIADGSYVVNDSQTHSELTVSANVGDNIRWTITNPSADFTMDCLLYGFKSAAIGTAISNPACQTSPVISYYNSLTGPTVPAAAAYMYSVWVASVLSNTQPVVQYTWNFQVLDASTGVPLGYFTWDPFIQIAQATT